MLGLPSLYLRLAGYGVAALMLTGLGYKLGASHWQTKYHALQTADYQGIAQRELATRKALEGQLAQARATSTNNAQVLHDLQTETAAIVADRDHTADLVRRLLASSARHSTASTPVPEAADQPGAARAGTPSGDGRAESLLIAAAEECRRNSAQLDALSAQIRPQL